MWGIDAAGWSAILFAVAWLVLLEGLLSADNALVLAVMVRHLPKQQQKRALRFGIWGAFIFRLIAVIFATILLKFWWLKVAGGLYLLVLAIRHFLSRDHDEAGAEAKPRTGPGFWTTVINVEIADIAFSIDSILAAVAMADRLPDTIRHVSFATQFGDLPLKLVIIYLGGVLGIITMRLVAGVFLVVLERFQGLAEGAYVLVGWIGVSLIESGIVAYFHRNGGASPIPEIPEWFFWTVMVLIIVVSLLYKPKRPTISAETTRALAEEMSRPGSDNGSGPDEDPVLQAEPGGASDPRP